MSNPYQPPVAAEIVSKQPTRVRFIVLAFLCAMAFVLYLDRVCMSKAVPSIKEELRISNERMGLIMAAFTLAYGLFEVPTGRWGDRFGSRRVLARIVACWSLFTALTGACFGFWSLLFMRFLFGAGEAGAYPNAARVIATWFPRGERGRVQGLMLSASLIGGTVAPIATGYLIKYAGWRATFFGFGLIGVVWAVAFFRWFREQPRDHPQVNDAERNLIAADGNDSPLHHEAIPWRSVLSHPCIWLLGTITSFGAFNSYVYFSWYATYLEEGRGVDSITSGWLAGMVLAAAAAGQLVGGYLADGIVRRFVRRVNVRRCVGCGSYFLGSTCLLVSVTSDSALVSAMFAAASFGCMMFQQSTWWACAIEVSGKHIGSLFGLMNGMGCVGAISSQYFFGALADWRKARGFIGRDQWDPAIYVVVVGLLLGGIVWLFVNSSRPVDAEESHE